MKGDVVAHIYRSDGEEYILGNNDWRIPKNGLENWANLPYSVSSVEIPTQDGAIVTSKRVASVDRTITAEIENASLNAELRDEAIRFFNPKYSYDVHLTYLGRTRWCHGEQIGFKCSEGNMYERATLEWTILCANPFLQGEDDFGRDIAEVVPRFGFPFMSFLPIKDGSKDVGLNKGFLASKRVFNDHLDIDLKGDVPSPIRVVMQCDSPVKNPSVIVNRGYVKVLITLNQGDKLEIDATQRPPRVELNGQNIMHKVDRRSSITALMIDPGISTVRYDADDGEAYLHVVVHYTEQFLGI